MTAAHPTASLSPIELFEVGRYQVSEPIPGTDRKRTVWVEYTPQDLFDMVRNFNAATGYPGLEPALVIGHEEGPGVGAKILDKDKKLGSEEWQKAFADSGLPMSDWPEAVYSTGTPAAGWVTNLRVRKKLRPDGRRRHVLMCDGRGVPHEIAGLINAGHYKFVSAEVLDRPPPGAPANCRGKFLRRLAVLGGHPPNLTQLAPLPPAKFGAAWAAGAARVILRPVRAERGDGVCRVFSEVIGMDREAMTQALLKAGWTKEEIDAIKDDAVLGVIVQHEMTELQGGGAPPASTMAAPGAGATPPDVETMIADLVAIGEDEATLRAMPSEELAALWREKTGTQMAAPTATAAVTVPAGTPPETARAFAALNQQITLLRAHVGTLRQQTAAEGRIHAAGRLTALRRAAADHLARWGLRKFCTPSELDPGFKGVNVYHRLHAAAVAVARQPASVRKFGSVSLNEFDAVVAEIDARGEGWAARNTNERIEDPEDARGFAQADASVDAYVKRRYGKRQAVK